MTVFWFEPYSRLLAGVAADRHYCGSDNFHWNSEPARMLFDDGLQSREPHANGRTWPVDFRHWRDILIASDPGLSRFRQAARTTLAAGVASLILFHLMRWVGQPSRLAFVGIYASFMGSMLVNDPQPAAQRLTTILIAPTAAALVTLGTLVAPLLWLNNVLFVFVIFGAVYIRRFGPRFVALGMMAFMGYFISLFFHFQFSSLPWMLVGIVIGTAITYALRFWLFRDRPESILRQSVGAYDARVRLLLNLLAEAARARSCDRKRWNRIRGALGRINEQASALQDQIASGSEMSQEVQLLLPDLRQRVFEIELSLEEMADALWKLVQGGTCALAACEAVSHSLDRLAAEWPHAPERLLISEKCPASAPNAEVAAAIRRFDDAVRTLAHIAQSSPQPTTSPAQTAASGGESKAVSRMPNRLFFRQAVQAAIAGGLAMIAGQAISMQRWYWAVIASFVIFNRTTTRGQTLIRAAERILGTVVGILIGLGIAEIVHGRRSLEIALLFVCLFLAYYFLRVSYALMILCFTTLLAVLYSLLGQFAPDLLVLRLFETLAGAFIGIFSAAFILPVSTTERVRAAAVELLKTSAEFLDTVATQRCCGQIELLANASALDRRLNDLRETASSWEAGLMPRGEGRVALFHDTGAVVYCARQLARAPEHLLARPEIRNAAHRLAENARTLSRALEGQTDCALEPVTDLLECAERDTVDPSRDTPAYRTVHWMRRLDEALQRLKREAVAVS